ncbi:hypothetical protein JH26_10700 [Microvirga sp. BSC39]|nr:hypothetical protein JH26_10700 [Microvirga sp. BSC39]
MARLGQAESQDGPETRGWAEFSADILGKARNGAAEVLGEAEDHRHLAGIAGDCLQALLQRLGNRHQQSADARAVQEIVRTRQMISTVESRLWVK